MVMETPVNAPQQDPVAKLPNHEPRLTPAQAFNAASNARDTLVMRRSLDGDEHLCQQYWQAPVRRVRCNVRDMEGLAASVVLIAILLGVLLVVGGLVYLLVQRLPKRSPEPVTMRTRPLLGRNAWYGPAAGGHGHSPASPEGHAAVLVASAAAVYLAQAGQVLATVVVVVALMIIVLVKGTPPGGAPEWKESQARRDQRPATPGH